MEKAVGHILKSNEVRLEGRLQLNLAQAESSLAQGGHRASATQQVRIVENQAEFAVIQMTCSCGTKTYLRCEYTTDGSRVEDLEPASG